MNATITKTQNDKKTFDTMKGEFGYTSTMQAPKIQKITLSIGVGKVNKDKKRMELLKDRLARISGQAVSVRAAKKAIANFKSREGDIVGLAVTLRGERMKSFLDKLIHVVLPRVKDFRGISPKSIDEMGNISIGLREHTVFPETSDEDAKDVFGLAITITTTAKNKKEAEAFLKHVGIPFRQ